MVFRPFLLHSEYRETENPERETLFSAFKDTRKFDSMISFYQRDAAQTFIYVYNFICLSFKKIIVPII